ncbi:MAG: DUF4262 domain-containing protein [Saprospiraceae bacterium]|nr:DUF4262 domain-containing protein [Saprospiraceae bacterium]MBK9686438.1 DUF4262 domain-containing protein [Saprospiraceae bacterium]
MATNRTTGNIGLAKAGQTEVIEHLYFYQYLSLTSADCFQIPCLRQTENRYAPFAKMKEKTLDNGDKKLVSDIAQFGSHVLKVMEDDNGPGFAYSVGLFKTFNHPEIIIIGLKPDLAHILINNIGEDIKKGKQYQSALLYTDILDDFKCLMLDVPRESYKKYVGYGLWYYEGDKFPLLQCIYPTVKGIYPWEKEWPEDIIDLQPILGDRRQIEKVRDANGA